MPAEEEQLHEIDHGVARRLFKEYVQAKKAAGQSTKGLSYGKMLAKLSAEAGRLKDKLGANVEVRFQVKTIDGKVRLRALRDKGSTAAPSKPAPPPVAPPKLGPPPIPGAKKGAKPPPVAPPAVVPPKLAPPKALDETDEELGTTDIDHDDLDEMEEVDAAEFGADVDDSMRTTLAALMEQESEPLPPTVGTKPSDLTASQKLSFATLGDIAKRMDELAERKQAPARAAKAAHDNEVLEGESSGEADIRAVAASLKKKMEPEPEPGAPSGEVEGDSIPISLTDMDMDEMAPATGFGTSAAVSLAEHKPIVSTRDVGEDEPPTREFRADAIADGEADEVPSEGGKGGFPVSMLLLLIVVVAGGVGYVMYGDQLLGGGGDVASRTQAPPPASAPALELGTNTVEARGDDGDDEHGRESGALAAADTEDAATTGDGDESAGADGASEGGKKKKGKRKEGAAKGAGQDDGDGGTEPDDGGEVAAEGGEGGEGADGGEQAPPAKEESGQVDCLLDPNAPGCKKDRVVAEKKEEAPALPDKLSQNQLRDGFQEVKADAKTCGKHYGAETGTKVAVKVSIEGKTGGITKATPQDEHAGTALGKCVADALRRATFPPFASPAMGVTWSIRM